MGVYDSIMVPCLKCGTRVEFQSKSGPCELEVFKLEEAPLDVLADVNRHAPLDCLKCGTWLAIEEESIDQGVPIVMIVLNGKEIKEGKIEGEVQKLEGMMGIDKEEK
jgi:hypothetical protein